MVYLVSEQLDQGYIMKGLLAAFHISFHVIFLEARGLQMGLVGKLFLIHVCQTSA